MTSPPCLHPIEHPGGAYAYCGTPSVTAGDDGPRCVAHAPRSAALHSCLSCSRHPSTHAPGGDDACPMCGLGEEREDPLEPTKEIAP